MNRIPRMAGATLAVGLLAACGQGAGPTNGAQVTFNLSTAPATSAAAFLSDTQATATDTLVLDKVELVLRDIRFKCVE
ncbi:MAG TPA: hypothetical protein VNH46_07755, partial [Gemmatimonadales bacterium]|nr:hypothetical protein [Gemmatimonadales bacterium]